MSKKSNEITVPSDHLEGLIFYSFRYALGRMTYAVSDAADYIKTYKSVLTKNTRMLIRKEIKQAVSEGRAGMQMDVDEWIFVYQELGDK